LRDHEALAWVALLMAFQDIGQDIAQEIVSVPSGRTHEQPAILEFDSQTWRILDPDVLLPREPRHIVVDRRLTVHDEIHRRHALIIASVTTKSARHDGFRPMFGR